MKLTYKQIKKIIENTKKDLKNKCLGLKEELGYYMPINANWAYCAGWTYDGDLVVLRFGIVQ